MKMQTIHRTLSLLLLGLCVLFAGCSFLDPLSTEIGDVIERYCEEPESMREAVREDVNLHAAPHAIAVTCAGDERS